jgi:putative nucleotidyltransferase with HDIG domain
VDGLKTFPVVAQQALAVLSNPEFRVTEVTELIKRDPSLAGGVMRMANSAFFAGGRPVSSIQQAFVRLGRRSVQEVIAAVATMDLFPDNGGIGKRFRDHCAAVAAIVQTLAREFQPNQVEGIFLCGLLHDVGKMLLIESGEFDYNLQDPSLFRPDRMRDEEMSLLGFDHSALGAVVMGRWKLPEPIPWVTAWHHQPSLAYANKTIGPMVALIRVADQLDFIISRKLDSWEKEIAVMSDSADLAQADISADKLLDQFESLKDARNQALSMFGG